tara:strand:+ start:589 stop:1161 length:573 start_codon:yes stop_codon:yes gene_type:complete
MSFNKITNETDITGFLSYQQKKLLTPEQKDIRKEALYKARLAKLRKSPKIVLTKEQKKERKKAYQKKYRSQNKRQSYQKEYQKAYRAKSENIAKNLSKNIAYRASKNTHYVVYKHTSSEGSIYIGEGWNVRATDFYNRDEKWKAAFNKETVKVEILHKFDTKKEAESKEAELINEIGIENLVNKIAPKAA